MIGLGLGVALAPTRGGLGEISLSAGIADLPLGSVGANTLDGFTSPANTVSNPLGATPFKMMTVDAVYNYQFVLATVDAAHRDMEVDLWSYGTEAFLRLDDTGKAIRFQISNSPTNPVASISLVTGVVDGASPGTAYPLWYSAALATDFPDAGIGENIATDYFTVGASGCDIYLKHNGIELARVRTHLHMARGRLAIMSAFGLRQADVRLRADQAMYGNPGLVDLRDLGCKALKTTGAIAAASQSLTVADATGFEVGDPIILAVGGEAGEGERATVGVGGTYPALAYADLATMEADTGKPDGTHAYRQDNGQAYVSYGGVWSSPFYTYYNEKFIPVALKTTIEAIAGNVLTLADSSVAASTNGDVWFDNEPAMRLSGLTTQTPWVGAETDNLDVRLLDGDFAIGDDTRFDNYTGLTIYGGEESRVVVPDGVLNGEFGAYLSTGVTARDFSYLGNGRDKGFGLANRVSFTTCEGLVVERVNPTDGLTGGVIVYSTSEFTVQDCLGTMSQGWRSYVGVTVFEAVDCNSSAGQFVDCEVDSPSFIGGFEAFRSAGVEWIRPRGRNCYIAFNFSGGVIDTPDIVIEAMSDNGPNGEVYSNNHLTAALPVISINANAPTGEGWVVAAHNAGGQLINPRIIQEGYVNAGDESHVAAVIITSSPNWTVEGTFPAYPGQGLLYGPDYAPGADYHGPIGLNSDSTGTVFRGIRCIGETGNGWGGINAPADAVVENCISDLFRIAGVLVPPPPTNMTNADWLALHPGDTIEEYL